MDNEEEFQDLTDEQWEEIKNLPCLMFHEDPFDFAYCESHDTTFPLGQICEYYREDKDS